MGSLIISTGMRVTKPPDKAELRAALERETRRFLQAGGEVKTVPAGVSGRDPDATPPLPTRRLFLEPRAERTPLNDVVAAIEERRKLLQKRKPPARRKRRPQPSSKMLYDDFGEPLRRVWVEE